MYFETKEAKWWKQSQGVWIMKLWGLEENYPRKSKNHRANFILVDSDFARSRKTCPRSRNSYEVRYFDCMRYDKLNKTSTHVSDLLAQSNLAVWKLLWEILNLRSSMIRAMISLDQTSKPQFDINLWPFFCSQATPEQTISLVTSLYFTFV